MLIDGGNLPTRPTASAIPTTDEPHSFYGRPLHAWESIINGRPQQVRPMTRAEVEQMDEKNMMDSMRRQDAEHERKVQEAIREQAAEQKRLDQKRVKEIGLGSAR